MNDIYKTLLLLIFFYSIYGISVYMAILENRLKIESMIECKDIKVFNYTIDERDILTDTENGKEYALDECK